MLCTARYCVNDVMSMMQGVDFLADCHGDEELPYNFVNGTEGIPSWDKRLESMPHHVECRLHHNAQRSLVCVLCHGERMGQD